MDRKYTTTKVEKKKADAVQTKIAKDFGFGGATKKAPVAKKNNYFENIAKEINDVYQAGRRRTEMSQTSGPGTDEMANTLAGIARRQKGQLAGAILMGARYDRKGRRTK
jgi:hypothetical protein